VEKLPALLEAALELRPDDGIKAIYQGLVQSRASHAATTPTPPASHYYQRICPRPPVRPDYFGGRAEALAELKAKLKEGQTTAIVAVAGLGGIGKTTLARKVANELYDERVFKAVLWADLGQNPQPHLLLENWASYADRTYQTRGKSLAEVALQVKSLLEELIAEKCQDRANSALNRTLVVLDDVWDTSAEVARILRQACPANSTVLMTSRAVGAARNLGASVQRLDRLTKDEAVALLKEQLPTVSAELLGKLGQVLGGHPLALTLAAKRVLKAEVSPARTLASQLEEYTKKLPQGVEFQHLKLDQAEGREDNLTLVLSYSYQELAAADQARFRALGGLAYDQPFDKGLLAAIWQLADEELDTTCDRLRLASLLDLDYSLTLVSDADNAEDSSEGNQKIWYRQHPLLHAYAHALLKASQAGAEKEVITNRYQHYVTEVITKKFWEWEPENWGREINLYLPHVHNVGNQMVAALPEMLTAFANSSAAINAEPNQVATNNATPQAQLELSQLFALNTRRYMYYRREIHQMDWLEMGLTSSQALANQKQEAEFLNDIGLAYSNLGENDKALEYYQQALPLHKAVRDTDGEATTLSRIGLVYSNLGENDKALEHYQQALPLLRAVGNKRGEAATLSNIGMVYSDLWENDKALDYFLRSLPLDRAVGDKSGEAITLNNIGGVYSDLWENDKALDYYLQALPLLRAVGDRSGEATTLTNIGAVYSGLWENDKALDYYLQALPLRRAVGNRSGEVVTSYNIGAIYYRLGKLVEAIEYLARCVELDKQMQHPDLARHQALLARWQQELADNQKPK
jgi:tetratricopeptide (TPR) repeat protein